MSVYVEIHAKKVPDFTHWLTLELLGGFQFFKNLVIADDYLRPCFQGCRFVVVHIFLTIKHAQFTSA